MSAQFKFQTVERDSFFNRLDFRTKLVMMICVTVLAFLWENPWLGTGLLMLVLGLSFYAGVSRVYLRLVLTILLPFFAFVLLIHGFFNVQQVKQLLGTDSLTPVLMLPETWWLVGGKMLSLEGLLYGLNVIVKTLTMTLVIPLGVFTTDIDNMVVSMVRAHIPYKIAFIFSSTLRFFPLLVQEVQVITEAQRLRGLAFEKMGPLRRLQLYARMAIPLILGAMVKSQQLELVLQSKAFSGDSKRTYLHRSDLAAIDYALMIFMGWVLLGAVFLYVRYGFGAFVGV